ncbi:hypothetical protein PHISP_06137 [Aspergillus sp. HF37]|nr:hypothetical protein PHISP_06137 [Aspergillus sp. HF37]
MLSSPAKRRKISRTSAVDASQTKRQPFDHATRAGSHELPSFQSPTKASLTRSSREFIPHEDSSPTRSPRRPGGRQDGQDDGGRVPGIRDRKAVRRSLGSASPMSALRNSPRKTPGDIQAFAVPPRRVSRKIMPSDIALGSPMPIRNKAPESLRTNVEVSGLDGAADEGDENMDLSAPLGGLEEPDLPPTPAQLEMMPPPGGPKGLIGTSPSARHATRSRRKSADTLKSRPLNVAGIDAGAELGGLPGEFSLGQPLLPEAVSKRQKLKKDLSAERRQLKDEIAELQGLTEKLNDPGTKVEPGTEDFNKLMVSASKPGSLRENHNLTFTAPHPFPPGLYNISVEYESDPETQSLTAVSVPDSREDHKSNIPQVLRRWIDTRLANPLLKLDVSSLCWGINRYWEAALSRAQIWTKLEKQHSNLVAGGGIPNEPVAPPNRKRKANTPENDSGTVTRSELGHMISHLERSTMLFEPSGRGKGKGKTAAKVLLSCTLALDEWTSEPHLTPEISVWLRRRIGGWRTSPRGFSRRFWMRMLGSWGMVMAMTMVTLF